MKRILHRGWGTLVIAFDHALVLGRFPGPLIQRDKSRASRSRSPGFKRRTGSDEEVLKTVRGIVESGAAGVFFDRNIFPTDNMPDLLQRVRTILAGNGLRKDHDL